MENSNKYGIFSFWFLCYIFLNGIYVFLCLLIIAIFMWIFCSLTYVFHYKYLPLFIFSTRNIFHSRMWPYQIYVTITIIVSSECSWDIVPSNWKNPMFSVMFPKFSLNVWKHMINNFNFTFFSNLYFNYLPHFSLLLVLKVEDQESLNCANRLLGVPF